MPVVVCPECGGELNVPDRLVGKKVKCSSCKGVFEAKPAPEEAEDVEDVEDVDEEEARPKKRRARADDDEDDEDDRPRRRRRDEDEDEDEADEEVLAARQRKQQVFWIRLSGLLLFIGTTVTFGGVALLFLFDMILVLVAVSSSATSAGGTTFFDVMRWLNLLLVGITGALAFGAADTGLVFGLLGPKKKNAFGLSIAAISVAGVHLLIMFIGLGVADTSSYAMPSLRPSESVRLGTSLIDFDACFVNAGFRGRSEGVYGSEFDFLFLLTALLEAARIVLLSLWMRAVLRNYKRSDKMWLTMIIVSHILSDRL